MAQGLSWLAQDNFSAGAIRSIPRHLIPSTGAYSIENGLLDADGAVYRRGGSVYASTAAAADLLWMWTGHLAAGQRTVLTAGGTFYALNGATPVAIGGMATPANPGRGVVVNGMLFIPGGTIYAGSMKTADYAVGSIDVVNGSRVVTGTGTSWLANVDAGMLLKHLTRWHVVESVDSNTQVTLADPIDSVTGTGYGYQMKPLGAIGALDGYRIADRYATVAERLVSVEGNRIYFSNARQENGVLAPHVFGEFDYHELPEGALGLAAESVRDLLVVFATDGVWTISNMAYDLTDAAGNVQQQMQRTSQDVVLWGNGAGLASYRGSLVAPATDGVYLVDGVSPPVSVSESISPLLTEYVRAGHAPGGACVFNSHYFLPVLSAAGAVVDLLVCRLDRPLRAGNRSTAFFPWSWFRGHAGDAIVLTVQVSAGAAREPQLLAANGTDRKVMNLTGVFAPSAATASDANATAHTFLLETRDYPTGRGNVNTVRRARVRYEMVDAAADNPTLSGSYSTGGAFIALTPDGPEDTGANKHTWLLAADARFFRLRLESTDPAARLTLHSVEIAVRPSGKDR